MESYSDELSAFQESENEQIELLRNEGNSDTRRSHVYNTIPCYSEQEAQALAEKLVNEETSREAQLVLITWLEEGQCNERNSSLFYSLIHLCGNRVKKLQTEGKESLEDAQKAQKSLVKKSCCILLQLDEFEKLFETLDKGNIWGNFNQNEIEKIQEWRRDSFNFKKNICKCSVVIEKEDENVNNKDLQTENVADKLQTNVGSSIYGLHTFNQKSEDPKTRCSDCENEILKLKSELEKSRKLRKKNSSISVGDKQQENSVASQCNPDQVYQNKMHIISLISIFLFENPDGVNLDGIYYHLQQCSESNGHIPSIGKMEEIENLMRECPQEFEESSPVGSIKEKKWTCISTSQKTLTKFLNEQ